MRNTILISFMLMLLTTSAYSQSKKDLEVIAVAKQAVTAQESYDTATLEKVYASDYIEISPKGEIENTEIHFG